MISTIVVGTDGSGTARRAVAVAADLARQLQATLHVVHGYQAPAALEGAGPALEGAAISTSSLWEELSAAVLERAIGDPSLDRIRVERHSVPGGAWQGLVEVARRVGADLIVVGNRGIGGPGPSVPGAVVAHAPCHVLIVKTT
ncbi:MAG: universal stress protein [Acidimicrobiales bacterium]